MKYIIIISKGHNVYNNGVFDNGSVSIPHYEAKKVDEAGDIFVSLARKQGHTVYDITPKNQHFKGSYYAHRKRADSVNKIYNSLSKEDRKRVVYLDWHTNAGGGTGVEILLNNNNPVSREIGTKILNSIVKETGFRNRGLKHRPGFWSVSMVIPPALILEGGFTDNKNDMKTLTPDLYARSVAKAFGSIEEDKGDEIVISEREYSIIDKDYKHNSFNNNGTLFTELRSLAENLGFDVSNKGNKALINCRYDKADFNGEKIMLENIKVNKNKTFVSLETLEELGIIEKGWNNETKEILIKTKEEK